MDVPDWIAPLAIGSGLTWLLGWDSARRASRSEENNWHRERAREAELESAKRARARAYHTRQAVEDAIQGAYELRSATRSGQPPGPRPFSREHIDHLRVMTAGPDPALADLLSKYNAVARAHVAEARALYERGDVEAMRALAGDSDPFVELEFAIMKRMEELEYPLAPD